MLQKFILFLLGSLAAYATGAQSTAVAELLFSSEGGYYDTTFTVRLYHPDPQATIYYTLDGTSPITNGNRYHQPLRIDRSSCLRAVVQQANKFGKIYAHTYLLNEPSTQLPTLAISIDPHLLFDSEQGLFMMGSQSDTGSTYLSGANFWSRREVPAHLEFYESDGSCVFNSALGLRLFGGMSRLFPQKSMALVTDKAYGASKIKHPVFGKEGPKSVDYLVLRNAGSDFGKAHARDAIATQQTKDWEVDVQAYRPAQVYINGQYWGLYNLREKINRHFLASHHDVDKDSLDLMEHYMTLKRGSRRHYQQLIRYIEQHDLSQARHYQQVAAWMDIESFIDFQIAQIFFDNRDAGGNIRYWRPQTENGKWRWILFDLDWAMGLHNTSAAQFNSLEFHTRPDGPRWPNPPWSTFLLRHLLENPGFRQEFITRFTDHLNQQLATPALLTTIHRTQAQLEPEIDRHLQRWKLDRSTWEAHFNRMRDFARQRPAIMRQHLQDYFGLDTVEDITIEVEQGGQVLLNRHLQLHQGIFQGKYFADYPIHLLAIPNLGYRFRYWQDEQGRQISSAALLEAVVQTPSYTAVFEKFEHPLTHTLLINEVMPTGKPAQDWIELYNDSNRELSLEGFMLSDRKGNRFVLPRGTRIGAHDFLVVCQDEQRFRKTHPMAYNLIGNLSFGINKHREQLSLFDPQGAMIDSLGYVLEPTDTDFTWSLLLPQLDNADTENWQVLYNPGTPNAANPYYMTSRVQASQKKWIQISLLASLCLLVVSLVYFSWSKTP